ncbi:MAG: YeeE/YedE thiosulfate transporter family protein [Proteobacteria bacterium]|nr:YeeE/YedE thiosulfate transporter family protein [Pseudomonadota bacterium]
MKTFLAAFSSALLFGLGLGVAGMTLPKKVIGFLDITGEWDPSLIAVMVGAILVHSVSYRLITKRDSPVLASRFQIPTRRDIDWKLISGSAMFGAGWGLGGFCPGPALVSTVTGNSSVLIFVLSMVVGILIYNQFDKRILQQITNKKG